MKNIAKLSIIGCLISFFIVSCLGGEPQNKDKKLSKEDKKKIQKAIDEIIKIEINNNWLSGSDTDEDLKQYNSFDDDGYAKYIKNSLAWIKSNSSSWEKDLSTLESKAKNIQNFSSQDKLKKPQWESISKIDAYSNWKNLNTKGKELVDILDPILKKSSK